MNKVNCGKCDGDGLYHAPTSRGPYCFRCKGTGQVNERKARAPKVRVLSATRRIADICGGDPSKMTSDQIDNPHLLDYLGITQERLIELRDLWQAGIREVAR
jgi:hypothetical protein